jgi:hypothetical protein
LHEPEQDPEHPPVQPEEQAELHVVQPLPVLVLDDEVLLPVPDEPPLPVALATEHASKLLLMTNAGGSWFSTMVVFEMAVAAGSKLVSKISSSW